MKKLLIVGALLFATNSFAGSFCRIQGGFEMCGWYSYELCSANGQYYCFWKR